MPTVSGLIATMAAQIRDLDRRLRRLHDHTHPDTQTHFGAYTWQSARSLTVSTGLRFYVERDGQINWCRADRSSGDGTTTATLDVLRNGASIYASSAKPTVAAATFLGPERKPDSLGFSKGDYFQIEIEATGGGTGPLRLTFDLDLA